MGQTTEISWTDATFSPWWGCTKVSPACDHCYAETFSKRVGYADSSTKFPIWGKDAKRRFLSDDHWAQPLKWNRKAARDGVRKRVFCGSMCDVMEDREDLQHTRVRLYNLIDDTPNLDWLLLTKRPQNFRRFLPQTWLKRPRPNVWGMTTVESAAYLWRIDALMQVPFAVRGLSVEPLLSELNLVPYFETGMIHWVIVGGESGPGARPMHPEWARSLCAQCSDFGVAYHFKQWGDWMPLTRAFDYHRDGWSVVDNTTFVRAQKRYAKEHGASKIISPGQLSEGRISECVIYGETALGLVGKKKAGRLLDGREWNEIPEVRA